jgi:hypothetical protein
MIKTAIVAILVAALFAHMWLWLPHIYANAASVSNEATGQIWPLNNHGRTVYVTRTEQLAQAVLTPILFGLAFAAGLWMYVSRARR